MFLVQLLLPQAANDGTSFSSEMFAEVRRELTEEFGGVTVYSQGPAEGLWQRDGDVVRDTIILFEVMQPRPRRKWWRRYRHTLESRFSQDQIVVRAQRIEVL